MKRDDTRGVTRRSVIKAAVATLSASLAAACSVSTTPAPSPTVTPPTPTLPPPRVTTAPSPSLAPATPTPSPVPPTPSPTPVTPPVLYVDNGNPRAADTNAGTEALPLRTIAKAVALAAERNARNMDVRVVVSPGTYRESVRFVATSAATDATIVFEAREGGTAIISGSDIWGDWHKESAANTYSHPWPYKWGLAPYPPGWQGNVVLKPIVRRREMIFLNGTPLTQVLSRPELKGGTFYVAEESGTVFLSPPMGVMIEGAIVEVATRAGIFSVKGARNLSVRGLTFTHDGSALDGTAAAFSDCTNLLVEDCQFPTNNWTGFGVHTSRGVVARNNTANGNGAIGMEAYQSKDLRYEANETSYNNWRGALGGFFSWATGGLKHLLVHGGVYRQHRSVGNHACGCWFDTDCMNIEVDDLFSSRNYGEGLFIEALQGPVTVTNSTICHNQQGPGVYTEGATNVTLQGNIIYDNGDAQIKALKGARAITDWETHKAQNSPAAHWTLQNNVIVGTNTKQNLIDVANSAAFLGTLDSDENLWFSPKKDYSFIIEQKGVRFDKWQSVSKQDGKSLLADPRFVAPEKDDFTPRDDSPLKNGKMP